MNQLEWCLAAFISCHHGLNWPWTLAVVQYLSFVMYLVVCLYCLSDFILSSACHQWFRSLFTTWKLMLTHWQADCIAFQATNLVLLYSAWSGSSGWMADRNVVWSLYRSYKLQSTLRLRSSCMVLYTRNYCNVIVKKEHTIQCDTLDLLPWHHATFIASRKGLTSL